MGHDGIVIEPAPATTAAEGRALAARKGAPMLVMERSAEDGRGGRRSSAPTSAGRRGAASVSR